MTRKETRLPGLGGNNPLCFLAAVGVQAVFGRKDSPALWWSDEPVPVATIDGTVTVEQVIERCLQVLSDLAKSSAMSPRLHPKGDRTAKYPPEQIGEYLEQAQKHPLGGQFASALIAEGSLARTGEAKPSDLYFAAGAKQFMNIARKVLLSAKEDVLAEALLGEWTHRNISSLGWDPKGYMPAALSPSKPGCDGKKYCYPGVEALALVGMSRHPVFAGDRRTLTVGCSGRWKSGAFTWPIWSAPAGYGAVGSLISQTGPRPNDHRGRWYPGWGITRVFQSQIQRSDSGGYGNFNPARIIWQRQDVAA